MQLKAIIDSQSYSHQKHKRLNQATGQSEESPELLLAETFMKGVLEGFSYTGNANCKPSVDGIINYGFEIINNREIYIPSHAMAAVIAANKLQEKIALFYA